MARDIGVDNNFQTEYSIRGDVRNATGLSFVTQQVLVGIFESVDLSAPVLSDQEIEKQRGDIETAVRQNQFTEAPYRVSISNIDYEDETITYSISTQRIDETITTDE